MDEEPAFHALGGWPLSLSLPLPGASGGPPDPFSGVLEQPDTLAGPAMAMGLGMGLAQHPPPPPPYPLGSGGGGHWGQQQPGRTAGQPHAQGGGGGQQRRAADLDAAAGALRHLRGGGYDEGGEAPEASGGADVSYQHHTEVGGSERAGGGRGRRRCLPECPLPPTPAGCLSPGAAQPPQQQQAHVPPLHPSGACRSAAARPA
jgi:hypothetical protein